MEIEHVDFFTLIYQKFPPSVQSICHILYNINTTTAKTPHLFPTNCLLKGEFSCSCDLTSVGLTLALETNPKPGKEPCTGN